MGEPGRTVLVLDPDESNCYMCCHRYPNEDLPFHACGEHFDDAKKAIEEAGIMVVEIRFG